MVALSYVILFVVGVMTVQKADAGLPEDVKARLKEDTLPVITACAEETQIPIEKMKELKEKKNAPTVDDANSCFFACIFKKTGMIDEKGLYSEEKTLEKARKYFGAGEEMDKLKEAAKSCNSVNEEPVSDGEKGCDRAKLLFNCIKDHSEKFGF